MMFKNVSNTQTVHMKLKKEWISIPPGETADVPIGAGINHPNLERVEVKKKKVDKPKEEDIKPEEEPEVEEKVEGDLNGDGKFDKKDVSLAAKVLGKGRKKKTKKSKK